MIELSNHHIEMLMILADDEGHAQWELSKCTGIAKSNLSNMLAEIKKENIVYEGEPRKTTNKKSKRPNTKEYPLYINKDRGVYEAIVLNIQDKIDEYDLYNYNTKKSEAANEALFKVEWDKLCHNRKGAWTYEEKIKFHEKFEKKALFKGNDAKFYKNKADEFSNYMEQFLLSRYTERMIEKFGFTSIFRINIVGTLDIWYRNRLITIALDKNLINDKESKEYRDFVT